ncbi:MAG: response regulator transcription factor [Sterolibacteriaceae bacterium]|nr:response regulator transcription factor [Candidatus Methylophosphatis haderslevensis]
MKLLVVEDHALVREGMVLTLRRLDRRVEVLEASTAAEAFVLIERHGDLDLILLDLLLPDANGLSLLHTVRGQSPMLPVIVVSALDDAGTIKRYIQAGANGFVPKSSTSDVLLDAVRAVLAGGLFVPEGSDAAGARGAEPGAPGEAKDLDLTIAQRRVFNLLVMGLSNREIGQSLGLTEGTVKIHVSKILRVLGVTSRSQAVIVAARRGLKL